MQAVAGGVKLMKCSYCEGRGRVYTKVEHPFNGAMKLFDALIECGECRGSGKHGLALSPTLAAPSTIEPARMNNPERKDLRAIAEEWIATHSQACEILLSLALEAAGRGRQFGVKLLVERLRWECVLQGWSDDQYKINNNLTAYLARWLIAREPMLEKFIQFRETRW